MQTQKTSASCFELVLHACMHACMHVRVQVVVRVDGVDLSKGSICGVMEAVNVPHARSPIITFWEGEIVDNTNHTFITGKWGAGR
jgi:hypothetical protein